MSFFSITYLALYFTVLLLLAIYGAHRYLMVYLYYKYKDRTGGPKAETEPAEWPTVTIQLPVFNEQFVVERLIDTICVIDYPPSKLEIQVLDDSTDETTGIARACVDKHQARGVEIQYLHRPDRSGFKAGALEEGLKQSHGEFVAIFDADFIPPPDILKRTIPGFADAGISMVQTRWDHLNRDYSLLTQVQAMMLDGHFVMEHGARHRSGRCYNFNGTAGIWRRSSIAEAGGWQHDTLTEDLDLSYRAQLAGQRFLFVDDVVSPAELPVDINAFKSQQHRWAKGSIQTARKLLPDVLRSDMPWRVKLEAVFHLTNNLAYLLMLMLSVLMFPSIVIRVREGWISSFWIDLPFLLAATVSISIFYLCAQREISMRHWKKRIIYLPFLMSIGIGICINNSKAVLEALTGYWTDFQRTPKFGFAPDQERLKSTKYRGSRNWLPALELLFAGHFALLIYYTAVNKIYSSIPFLLLFFVGFLYVGVMSLWPSGSQRIHG
ncbi:MAG: glycosyltransferase [Candidatus Latescibacteria bacterium]|nr:glycosyltransferase [Candidatus Latescibacterota bacterium]